MEPDFSGWATKAGIKCTDGRTIQPDAFKDQHATQVPLVWQHGHNDPTNVLGHAILENRPEGVYAYAFLNKSEKALATAAALEHGDIRHLSIWANQLLERAGSVMHGVIRELSVVLSGANPGAVIESVNIQHSDGTVDTLPDSAIIHTGLEIEHSAYKPEPAEPEVKPEVKPDDTQTSELTHAAGEDATIQEIYEGMTEDEQTVVHYFVAQALEAAEAEHSNLSPEGNTMANVFETQNTGPAKHVISHDAMKGIAENAKKLGSLKEAVQAYAVEKGLVEKDHLEHGITDIDFLFPEARTLENTPEWNKRRTEWVSGLLAGVRKSPFSRVRTLWADITHEEARAKGYIKGSLKKEEFFGISRRVTTPTTVYKKQKLDRDDMVDITDFDVVAWLKGEMRLMLDEEIARAILIGDGRDVASEDKINESNIRPIATDHEMYTTTLNVNVADASSSVQEIIDAIIMNRYKFRGTGTPNFYTTEYWISRFMLLRDTTGRRIYTRLDELAAELRVAAIIPVEVMEDETNMVGVIVNPVDYMVGADKGGNVSLFDDFDIDYNQYKYLIETRCSGALVKLKSAIVVRTVAGTDFLVTPTPPTYNEETGALTIVNTAGVVYKNGAGTVINNAGSPYTVAEGTTYVVNATPAAGYYFATSDGDSWEFTRPAA